MGLTPGERKGGTVGLLPGFARRWANAVEYSRLEQQIFLAASKADKSTLDEDPLTKIIIPKNANCARLCLCTCL